MLLMIDLGGVKAYQGKYGGVEFFRYVDRSFLAGVINQDDRQGLDMLCF